MVVVCSSRGDDIRIDLRYPALLLLYSLDVGMNIVISILFFSFCS